jgi:hypothetical protein
VIGGNDNDDSDNDDSDNDNDNSDNDNSVNDNSVNDDCTTTAKAAQRRRKTPATERP